MFQQSQQQCRPTQSEALYLQQVGRILRPQPGKIAIVLDHVGSTVKHGFVDDVRLGSLDSKPKRKKNDEPAPSVRQCPMCFAGTIGNQRVRVWL